MNVALPTSEAPNVNQLLARLDGVRCSGRGWTARCPAHEDRRPSLSISVGDDGRVLLHDFGGCDVTAVLAAIGLSVGDLFVKRDLRDLTVAERTELRNRARETELRAALGVLDREAMIVAIAAADLSAGRMLSEDDHHRLAIASKRLTDARSVLR